MALIIGEALMDLPNILDSCSNEILKIAEAKVKDRTYFKKHPQASKWQADPEALMTAGGVQSVAGYHRYHLEREGLQHQSNALIEKQLAKTKPPKPGKTPYAHHYALFDEARARKIPLPGWAPKKEPYLERPPSSTPAALAAIGGSLTMGALAEKGL